MKHEHSAVGGQAVIEGVMMRSPEAIAIAVRTPDNGITVKTEAYRSFTKRHRLFNIPLIRGAIILIESMVIGIKAITFSADTAMAEEQKKDAQPKKRSVFRERLSMVFTIVLAFGFGFLVFFYLPLVLTELLKTENTLVFNLVDGVFRLIFFLGYIYLIIRWKEMRRIFAYHGAEHMSIFAHEAGDDLTVENTRKYTTLHPRCGTSFLLIVMIVSIIVFIFVGRPSNIQERLIRFLFIPLIGGISYELTKLSDKFAGSWARVFILPGLWLQKLTTNPPDDRQLEVAIAALKAALEPVEAEAVGK